MRVTHSGFSIILFLLFLMGEVLPVMAADEFNQTDLGNESAISINNTSSSAVDTYGSLGDIIKAKDWKALGEYNCKIKAENADKFDDSVVAFGALKGNWNTYFTSPPEIIYTPCCG